MDLLGVFFTLLIFSGISIATNDKSTSTEVLEGAVDALSHLELLKDTSASSSSSSSSSPNRRITREYKPSSPNSEQLQTISYVTNHGTKSKKSSSISTIYNSRNYRFRTKNSVVSTSTPTTTTVSPVLQDLEDSSTILSNSYSNERSLHGRNFVSVTPFPHTLGPALNTALNAPSASLLNDDSAYSVSSPVLETSRPHRITYASSPSNEYSSSDSTSDFDSYSNYDSITPSSSPSPEYGIPSSSTSYSSPYEEKPEYGVPLEPKPEYGPAYETYTEYGAPPPPPPNKEIKFIIHKPGEEEIVKDIIIENSKLSGEKISFLQGPDLSIHHKQKIYLAPPKKSVVYILLKEPEIKTQVLIQEPRPEDVPKPEVFVIYESSNGMIKKHYDLSPEEGQKVADVLANKIRWTREDGGQSNKESKASASTTSTTTSRTTSSRSRTSSTTKSPLISTLIRNPRNNNNKDIKLLTDKKPNSTSNKESSSFSSDEAVDSEIMSYFETMKKQRKSNSIHNNKSQHV